MEPSGGPPTVEGPKQVHSIYPSLEAFKKPEGEDCDEEFDLGCWLGRLVKVKIDVEARVSGSTLRQGPKTIYTWLGGGEKTFLRILDHSDHKTCW